MDSKFNSYVFTILENFGNIQQNIQKDNQLRETLYKPFFERLIKLIEIVQKQQDVKSLQLLNALKTQPILKSLFSFPSNPELKQKASQILLPFINRYKLNSQDKTVLQEYENLVKSFLPKMFQR